MLESMETLRKGERTRQHILAKAAEVFNRKGFEGASMSDLIEATQIQKGGLYRHFESKEKLALEAFAYAFEQVGRARLDALDGKSTARESLKALLESFLNPLGPLIPGGCPLFNAAIDCDDGNEPLLAAVRTVMAIWLERITATIERGVAEGEFRTASSPEAISTFLFGSLEGALVIARVRQDRQPLRDAVGYLQSWLDSQLLSS